MDEDEPRKYCKCRYLQLTVQLENMQKTFEFTNFLEAKEKFFNILDFIVREGRRDVAKRGSYMYSSPLWDNHKK